MDNIVPDVEMQEHQSPLIGFAPQTFEDNMAPPAAPLPGEK